MSLDTIETIRQFLSENTINGNHIDSAFVIETKRGMRAKKVIDANRTNQNYYRTRDVQKDLLEHYESVDWWERDAAFDLDPYIERM